MEVWGDAILKAGGRDWLGIKGGKRAVVEAVTVRDLCAPDPGVQPQGGQPNSAAAGRNIALKEADPIKLEKKRFTNHTATLRALRVLADGVTSLSDVKKGP